MGLDLHAHENHVDNTKIDIGFAADRLVRELKRSKKIKEQDILSIQLDSKAFLIELTGNLIRKSPVTYALVWNLSWLNPTLIRDNSKHQHCLDSFQKFLTLASDVQQVSESNCDDIVKQYRQCMREWPADADFISFKPE